MIKRKEANKEIEFKKLIPSSLKILPVA